jgi:hypothetical protein
MTMPIDPSRAEASLAFADRLFSSGNFAESERIFAEVASSDAPASLRSQGCYGQGVIRLRQGDATAAEECLLNAYQLDPRNANACYYLGVISKEAGDDRHATIWYASALAANPDHDGALTELSLMATARGLNGPSQREAPVPDRQNRAPSEAANQTPAGPPRPPSSPHAIVGVASHVRQQMVPWRGKPSGMQQMTFRLECHQGHGVQRGDRFSVELRSHEVHGTVEDGDWIELPIDFDPRRSKPIKELTNLTTGERVYSQYRIFNAR